MNNYTKIGKKLTIKMNKKFIGTAPRRQKDKKHNKGKNQSEAT